LNINVNIPSTANHSTFLIDHKYLHIVLDIIHLNQ